MHKLESHYPLFCEARASPKTIKVYCVASLAYWGTIMGTFKMRILTTAAALAALIGGVASANADGMYGKASYKEAAVAAPFSWTGLYIGGTVGFGVGDTQGKPEFGDDDGANFFEALLSTDYDIDGSVYGIHIGYNFQRGNLVYGLEASINGSEIDGSTTCVFALKCERELDYYGTLVARLGYAVDRTMFYALGGLAYGEVNTDVSLGGFGLLSGEETHTGWTAGVGIEHALSDRFIIRVEYSHVDLGEEDTALKFGSGGLEASRSVSKRDLSLNDRVELEFDTVKIGASYKFGDRHEVLEPLK